jgi:hypothetical protein
MGVTGARWGRYLPIPADMVAYHKQGERDRALGFRPPPHASPTAGNSPSVSSFPLHLGGALSKHGCLPKKVRVCLKRLRGYDLLGKPLCQWGVNLTFAKRHVTGGIPPLHPSSSQRKILFQMAANKQLRQNPSAHCISNRGLSDTPDLAQTVQSGNTESFRKGWIVENRIDEIICANAEIYRHLSQGN